MDAIEASGFLPKEKRPAIPDVKIVQPFQPKTKQPAVSVEEREQLAAEIQSSANITRLETPREKYFRWVTISEQEQRSDEEQMFYESYQRTAEFRAERDICEEFGLTPDMAEGQ